MLECGSVYTVNIDDTTILGSGVAKIDGIAVFVPKAVKGDVCRIKITDLKKSYAVAECVEILTYSPFRRDADCPYFDRCGGCSHRNVNYNYEGIIKSCAVKSAFSKAGLRDVLINDTVLPAELAYRNNVQFHFDKYCNAGFFEEESNSLISLGEHGCRVIPDVLCKIANATASFFKSSGYTAPERLALRISVDGNVCAAVTSCGNNEEIAAYAEHIRKEFPCVTGVVSRKNAKDKYTTVSGDRYIETTLAGLRFRVSPEAFFQVNYEGAEKLFEIVLSYAEGCCFSSCADLYCGTGVIGMILASRYPGAVFTGVEINRQAVEDAKYNMKLNGLSNMKFFCGDAAGFASTESPELVVVDPPRRGLSDKMIGIIGNISPESIIYVSCNPFTLARDVKKLCEFGYTPKEATPVNMFPGSSHVETVVWLGR